MGSNLPGKIVAPTLQKHSLLSGAYLPFRILQLSGYFPLSLHSSKNTLSIYKPAWHRCPSTLWILIIIIITFLLTFISALLGNNNVASQALTVFANRGRSTIILTSTVWGFCCVFCPFFCRVDLLTKRARFAKFCENYFQLVEKFQNLDSTFEKNCEKHVGNNRAKLILHLILHLITTFIHTGLYTQSRLRFQDSFSRTNVIDTTRNLLYAGNTALTGFSLHGLIYFVSSYEFGITELLKCLENHELKVHDVVKVYLSLDKNVTQFISMFSTFLNINVVYVFVYLLYDFYFVYIAIELGNFVLGFITAVQILITIWYFYLLSNSASGLANVSKMFCKMVKYLYLKEEMGQGKFVKVTERFQVQNILFSNV